MSPNSISVHQIIVLQLVTRGIGDSHQNSNRLFFKFLSWSYFSRLFLLSSATYMCLQCTFWRVLHTQQLVALNSNRGRTLSLQRRVLKYSRAPSLWDSCCHLCPSVQSSHHGWTYGQHQNRYLWEVSKWILHPSSYCKSQYPQWHKQHSSFAHTCTHTESRAKYRNRRVKISISMREERKGGNIYTRLPWHIWRALFS